MNRGRRSPTSLAAAVATLLALVVTMTSPAMADKRVALVIGNSKYTNVPQLTNPANDAKDISEKLKRLGFEVVTGIDLDLGSWRTALQEFERRAQNSDAGLFYYAGHAMQYQGQNYLMPVNAVLKDETNLVYDMISVNDIKNVFARSNTAIRIMILDACRNNPLAAELARSVASLSRSAPFLTRGLARIDKAEGMVIVYATMADEIAEDGRSTRNSPFTSALLNRMDEPGVEIATLFRRVQGDVISKTGNKQRPELNISLANEFYLNTAETDAAVWNRVRESGDPQAIRDFIASFPRSSALPDAIFRLQVLERENTRLAMLATRDAEARQKAEAADSAKRRAAEEEEQRRAEAESRRQAEIAAAAKREADAAAKRKADEEHRYADAETKRQADIAQLFKRQAEARLKAEAEALAKRQADIAAAAAAKREAETQKEAHKDAAKKAEADAAARRKADEEQRQRAEAEARRQAEIAAAAKRDEEARRQAEADAAARRKADEEQRQRAEAEARRQAEIAAAAKRDEEARRQAEADAAARRKADEDQRQRADAEAKRQADIAAAAKREAEARQQAEAEAKRRADIAAAARREAEERKHAEAEAKRLAELAVATAKREAAAQKEAQKRADAEAAARRKVEEAQRKQAEADAKRQSEIAAAAAKREADAQKKAEAEAAAKVKAEDEQRLRAEVEAKRQAEIATAAATKREADAQRQAQAAAAKQRLAFAAEAKPSPDTGPGSAADTLRLRREKEAAARTAVKQCVEETKKIKAKASAQDVESRLAVEVRIQIQKFLIDRGYLDAAADGTFDASSRQAIKKFQTALGVGATGYLTSCEMQALHSGN